MATSISIKGKTTSGDSTTATVNYVNPKATDGQLVSLATALNNLTTNTISDVTKISKESLTDNTRIDRNLYLSKTHPSGTPITSITLASIKTTTQEPTTLYILGTVTGLVESDFQISIQNDGDQEYIYSVIEQDTDGLNALLLLRSDFEETPTGNATVTITVAGNETYNQATITLQIN